MKNILLNSERPKAIRVFDKLLSALAIICVSPVYIFNSVFCLVNNQSIFSYLSRLDATGRAYCVRVFNGGILTRSALLLDIYFGEISFCGVSMQGRVSDMRGFRCDLPVGVFSVFGVKKSIGEGLLDHRDTLESHMHETSLGFHLTLLLRGLLNECFYHGRNLKSCNRFSLQGVTVDNCSMNAAIDWVVAKRSEDKSDVASFINVNSINLAHKDEALSAALSRSDRSFADGSGVRLAARHQGVLLKDNVNGTDLLPRLCERLQSDGLSVFLLGSSPGVADDAAKKLQKRFPKLKIAGTHHGYFSAQDDDRVIDLINASRAHLCLVAMGSPRQELWLDQHRDRLKVSCAMAVGGLFDFFSGRIPRAPMWMRDIGFEWLWRLWQEPAAKFQRYVVGNPQFLYNTYFGKTRSQNYKTI